MHFYARENISQDEKILQFIGDISRIESRIPALGLKTRQI